MLKIGWFSTGRDEAARDLLTVVNNSIQQGEIETEIAFVFCSRETGEASESDLFIGLVEEYHIPIICFSYQKFKSARDMPSPRPGEPLPPWRIDYDSEVMKRLEQFRPDLCILAGYMLITGPEMCQRYNMINLHPAMPGGPAGTWQEVIWQLMTRGAPQTGVMMHLVTPELDMGPPVAYCTFSIRGKPFDRLWDEISGQSVEEIKKSQGENNRLFKLVRQHGLAREFPLILATIKAFSQGKIRVTEEKRIVDSEGQPINGYNLTDEIEKQVKGVG